MGEAALVDVAVARQPEHRSHHLDEPVAGCDLDDHLGLLVADLPPVVRRAGGHLRVLSGAEHPLAAVDHEPDLARQHVEALGDRWVVMLGRHATARADEQVGDEHTLGVSSGVGEDHHALPAGRIGEYLSRS